MLPDFTIDVEGHELLVTEMNTWVCIFTDAPEYDHLYIFEPSTFVIFNCREILDKLMHMGYPIQVRPSPLPWDEKAYDHYILNQMKGLEAEIEELDSE